MKHLIESAMERKCFDTLAAQYALAGFELTLETGLDGVTRLFVLNRGKVQPMDDLDHARALLAQIADGQ